MLCVCELLTLILFTGDETSLKAPPQNLVANFFADAGHFEEPLITNTRSYEIEILYFSTVIYIINIESFAIKPLSTFFNSG